MHFPSRSPDQDFDDDLVPDSSVRPTAPPSQSREVGAVRTRLLQLRIHVSAALLGGSGTGYVTVSAPEGGVLFEGDVEADGHVELAATVAADVRFVKVMLEAGTKYRNATVVLAESGPTEYIFS
jgi:hypothetical protein